MARSSAAPTYQRHQPEQTVRVAALARTHDFRRGHPRLFAGPGWVPGPPGPTVGGPCRPRRSRAIVPAAATGGRGARGRDGGRDEGARNVLTTSEVLDHPKRAQRLAVLDIVPTYDIWTRMNHVGAMQSYHWPLLPQPAPVPERLIGNDSDFYERHLLDRWAGRLDTLDTVAVAEHVNQSRNASVVQAVCKDYRAGATVDFDDDQAGVYARRCLTRPVLLLWGRRYLSTKAKSPLEIWKIWANDVTEVALDRGHFIAQEQPKACAKELVRFFAVVESRAMRV
jgi:hypothetical protein